MLPEARLDIVLRISGDTVVGTRILSTRLVQAARLFAGRRSDEVLALLPTVFSLCGTAQAMAGLAAMENATAIRPAPAHLGARRLLLLAEAVAEHGLGLARDWPALIGEDQNLAAARRIKSAMAKIRDALYPHGDWRNIGGGDLEPDFTTLRSALTSARTVVTDLLGAEPDHVLADLNAFQSWLAMSPGPASRVLAHVIARGWAGYGAAPFTPMPRSGPSDLAVRMATDLAGGYLARPDCGGVVFETGPLSRRFRHPLSAALLAAHGAGLLTRLSARLVDIAECLHEMDRVMQDLNAAPRGSQSPATGIGIAVVEAARGQLAHRVELENGRVRRYQILAPTEWNFHPDGALARGLAGTAAGPDLEERARLLAHALDPCVSCSIQVETADA
jgi:hypothetical protein